MYTLMAAFKDEFSKKSIAILADAVRRAHPAFPVEAFVTDCLKELSRHELKGRVDLIARQLKRHLPASYPEAVDILIRATDLEERLDGFQIWPLTHFVLLYGLEDFETSMQALEVFTQRFTAEFAIRPFLRLNTEPTLERMRAWARHENVHLRRLASEGSRPLLPWGEKLQAFVKSPDHGLAILELLKHDPEEYVRKSVANHLNDFSKHHPEIVVKTLTRWKREAPKEHEKNLLWIARHATRTLLKKGHPGAMKLQGLGTAKVKASPLKLGKKTIRMGEKLEASFTLSLLGRNPQKLMIDYAIHHRKANGKLQPKVFKHAVRSGQPGEKIAFTIRHAFRPITTRRYYGGEHAIEILVNGVALGRSKFELKT